MKHIVLVGTVALAMAATSVLAQAPMHNVRFHRHPNLAAAQRLTQQAYNHVIAAQRANEFDLGGHAAKAKELLEEASHELSEAAGASNERHR